MINQDCSEVLTVILQPAKNLRLFTSHLLNF